MLELDRKFTVGDIPVLRAEMCDADARLKEIEKLPASIILKKAGEVKFLGDRIMNISKILKNLRKQLRPAIRY